MRTDSDKFYSTDDDDMLRPDRRSAPRPQLRWQAAGHLESTFADHVQLSRAAAHVHLVFGQTNVAVSADERASAPLTEIRPVARVILSEDALRKLARLARNMLAEQG